MACYAVRQTLNLVFLYQPRSKLQLPVRVLVGAVEYLVAGPDKSGRIAMALHAPLHIQRVHFIHQRHLVHSSMTRRAPDTLVHVNAVIEVHKIGQVVDPCPFKRFPREEAGPDRLEHVRIRPDMGVAAHARFSRRKSGERGCLDRSVAIAAVNAVVAHVVLVAKWNRLIARHIHLGDEGTSVDFISGL